MGILSTNFDATIFNGDCIFRIAQVLLKNVGVQASEIPSGGKHCALLIGLVVHMELFWLMKYT